uniref:Uncharacterized protein n=1 Tax=Clytia hemisphaerica TaxID=252671 RepID=A0A7M5UM30_9CNID
MTTLEKVQENYIYQEVPGTITYIKSNAKNSQIEKLVEEIKCSCYKNNMTGSDKTRNVMLFFSNFLTESYKLLREVSNTGSCSVLAIGFLSKYFQRPLEIINWLPYHRFISHITPSYGALNTENILQSHKDLIALISNPDFNRFDDRYFQEQLNFLTGRQTSCDKSVCAMLPQFYDNTGVVEMDSILQFVSLLARVGLQIVAVLPEDNTEFMKTLLQKLKITYKKPLDYHGCISSFYLTFPRGTFTDSCVPIVLAEANKTVLGVQN